MEPELLEDASEELDRAAALTGGERAERLSDLADQYAALAGRDRGPDHGRLARLERSLGEVRDDLDGEARERVDAATRAATDYREDVEGV